MVTKAYQAITAAETVNPAIAQNARNSLALMPNVEPRLSSRAAGRTRAVPMGSEVMPRRLASSRLETFDGLEAAVGLDDRQENPVHALVIFRTVG